VYGANDQLTNTVACAWFELHPNLRYIKYKVAEPDQVARTPVIGSKDGSRTMGPTAKAMSQSPA